MSGIGVVKTANPKESGSVAMMLSLNTPQWISVSFVHLKLSEMRTQSPNFQFERLFFLK